MLNSFLVKNVGVGSRTNTISRRGEKSSRNRFPVLRDWPTKSGKKQLGSIFQGTVKTCVFLLWVSLKIRSDGFSANGQKRPMQEDLSVAT
jgi:hypothetical protein